MGVASGLGKCVTKRFPSIKVDAQLRKLVNESDLNHDGKIQFDEYLWLMRRLQDWSFKQLLASATAVRQELGYNKHQVRQLRELFNIVDVDLSGTLDFMEFLRMMRTVQD